MKLLSFEVYLTKLADWLKLLVGVRRVANPTMVKTWLVLI